MALFLNVDDVVTVRVNSSDGQSQIFNVLHYKCVALINTVTGLPAPNQPNNQFLPELGDSFLNGMLADWQAASSVGMSLNGCTVQNEYPDVPSAAFTVNLPAPEVGLIAGDMLPAQDCVTILKKTSVGARWGLGRYFHSGIPESEQQKGTITVAYNTLVQAYADKLEDLVVVTIGNVRAEFQACLFGEPAPPLLPRITLISRFEVSDRVIKTQRRRRPGKGI